jgi:hypothetical protein
MDSCTDLRTIISEALTSTHLHSAALKVSFPSIGTPKASTTQLNKAFPTRTSTRDPARLTMSPSLMAVIGYFKMKHVRILPNNRIQLNDKKK